MMKDLLDEMQEPKRCVSKQTVDFLINTEIGKNNHNCIALNIIQVNSDLFKVLACIRFLGIDSHCWLSDVQPEVQVEAAH